MPLLGLGHDGLNVTEVCHKNVTTKNPVKSNKKHKMSHVTEVPKGNTRL